VKAGLLERDGQALVVPDVTKLEGLVERDRG
jgi:hypothetical protein